MFASRIKTKDLLFEAFDMQGESAGYFYWVGLVTQVNETFIACVKRAKDAKEQDILLLSFKEFTFKKGHHAIDT